MSDPRTSGRSRWHLLLALLAVLSLIAAACGDDGDSADGGAEQSSSDDGDSSGGDSGDGDSGDNGGSSAAGECAADEVSLVYSGRTLANPYYVAGDAGAQFFADSVGAPYQFLASESDSAQQLSQIQAILAADGPCVALNVDPNETSIVPQILEAVEEAGACMVTQWSRPDDLSPLDSENWAAHVTFDGVAGGEAIATALFESMGGEGNIVALQGILDNSAARTRFEGLKKALENFPGITLLDDQTAGWQIDEAQSVTEAWLAQYGDDIDGIWAANDGMGIGAVEALRAAGKAGDVPVVGIDATPEGLAAVESGEFVVTISPDAPYQGGIGLAICHQVLTGQLDITSVADGQRVAFHDDVLIGSNNVGDFTGDPNPANYEALWADPFSRANTPALPSGADDGSDEEAMEAQCAADEVSLVYSGRTLANPYYVAGDAGAQFFADSVGAPYQFLASESDSAQQLSQIQAILAADGPCVALNVDPNETSIVPQILEAVEEAGACMVTQWSRPDDLSPLDSENWAAHVTFDGVAGGEAIATALFESMGGEGNIVALQGILDNSAARTRFEGLKKALENFPGITLLDDQTAGWQIDEAQSVTEAWLAQYGDDIDGIWAANDGMGIGAVEALRAAGKAGDVPVVGIDATPEGLAAVESGEFVVTISPDAPYQGGIGLAICHQVLTGQLDITSVADGQRVAFHDDVLIGSNNVGDFTGDPNPANYEALWADPFSRANTPAL